MKSLLRIFTYIVLVVISKGTHQKKRAKNGEKGAAQGIILVEADRASIMAPSVCGGSDCVNKPSRYIVSLFLVTSSCLLTLCWQNHQFDNIAPFKCRGQVPCLEDASLPSQSHHSLGDMKVTILILNALQTFHNAGHALLWPRFLSSHTQGKKDVGSVQLKEAA